MTKQHIPTDPVELDYDTIQRYVAVGRRARALAFSQMVRSLFRRDDENEKTASKDMAPGTPAHC